jgi:toxin YoeB
LRKNVDRQAVFLPEFLEDLTYWVKMDRKVAIRTLDLVAAILRDPFQGIGKPEPLRHSLGGAWSRRITSTHRLVYKVTDSQIEFWQARFHY